MPGSATEEDMLSYAHGADDGPLIGQTISDFFDAVRATNADHYPLVSRHRGHLVDVGRAARPHRPTGERVDSFGDRKRRPPSRHLVARSCGGDGHAVRYRVDRGDPRQYRPGVLRPRAGMRLRQSGCSMLIIAPLLKTSSYAALLSEICPELQWSTPGQLRAEKQSEHEVRRPETCECWGSSGQ